MESSHGQRFDKTTIATSETALPEMCRLRNNLNSDCLLKIFQYLNLQDLLQLSKMDTYFYDLIASEIIPKSVINLGVMDERLPNNQLVLKRSTMEMFDMFGKFMKKFVIRGDSFSLFLTTIITYCTPNRLTQVDLEFKRNTASLHLIDQSMPFFLKLCKLRLFDIGSNGLYQHFLTKLSQESTSIEILQLEQVDIVGGWLQKNQNLTQLMLHRTSNISLDDLTSCYKVNPKLKAFEYKGIDDLTEAYRTLSVCCPGLRTFSDCHLDNPYDSLGADMTNMMRRYDFLSLFEQLDSVTLTSYTESGHDLHHHLSIPSLAKISTFKVYMSMERPIVLSDEIKTEIMESCSIPSLNYLKTVEIQIQNIGDIDCNLRCEFIFNLVSQLRNVENIKFVGSALTNVDSIFRYAKNIRRLCIAETHFRKTHISQELRNIMRFLLRVPIRNPSEEKCEKQLLHLKVNKDQWNHLQVYENTERIMSTLMENDK